MTGRKPVPLQAGHISSTMSDFVFIGFIKRVTPALNDQIDNYTSHKLRNQLWGVTLNEKVKLTRLLIVFVLGSTVVVRTTPTLRSNCSVDLPSAVFSSQTIWGWRRAAHSRGPFAVELLAVLVAG